jgi:hypothetical protein
MKKVIDGKLYNTDTAQEIAEDHHGYTSDFHHWSETLYQTRKGSWFLYGEGGALSQYSVSVAGYSGGAGDAFIPFTAGEALNWLEQHASADVVLEHFGSKVEEA